MGSTAEVRHVSGAEKACYFAPMRLGLLGPARSSMDALENAARFLLGEARTDRTVYLGNDDLLDRVVHRWAAELVTGNPSEALLWQRATERCLVGEPEAIDVFVAAERRRQALKALESLPGDSARTIEILEGQVAVLIHDREDLDQEDLLSASFVVFGSSADPVIKEVGNRWFLSPGTLDHFGVMTLEDGDGRVMLTLYDRDCCEVRRQSLGGDQGARLRVSGHPRA